MMLMLMVLGLGAAIASDMSKKGRKDTVVTRGDSFFHGRYKKVKGECFRCGGTGSYHGHTCRKCDGTGVYKHTTWYR